MNRNGSLMRTATVALLLVSLSTVDGSERSSQAGAMSQPIRQIDHIMIRTGDPRLVPANENRVQTLLIRVASFERAKAFLREKHLLGLPRRDR